MLENYMCGGLSAIKKLFRGGKNYHLSQISSRCIRLSFPLHVPCPLFSHLACSGNLDQFGVSALRCHSYKLLGCERGVFVFFSSCAEGPLRRPLMLNV